MPLEFEDLIHHIGTQIFRWRRDAGHKQNEPGVTAELSHSVISLIEHGRYDSLKLKTLFLIARHYDKRLGDALPQEELGAKGVQYTQNNHGDNSHQIHQPVNHGDGGAAAALNKCIELLEDKVQRLAADVQRSEADKEQLRSENEHLREELTRLRA